MVVQAALGLAHLGRQGAWDPTGFVAGKSDRRCAACPLLPHPAPVENCTLALLRDAQELVL